MNGFKKRLSDNRVLFELVERVLKARRKGKRRSWHPAERFRATSDPTEVKEWGDATGKFNLAVGHPGLGRGGGFAASIRDHFVDRESLFPPCPRLTAETPRWRLSADGIGIT